MIPTDNPDFYTSNPRRRKWFPIRLDEPGDVEVLMPHDNVRPDNGTVTTFEPTKLPTTEKVVRVFPSAERPWEVLFLQMLQHRKQKWAPADGDGIIVLEGALPVSA